MEKKEVIKFNVIPETITDAMIWQTDFRHLRLGITHHFQKTSLHYLICGCLLCEAETKKIWDKDGNGAGNFWEWVEKVVFLKRTQVQRMMLIWRTLKPIIEKHSDLILQVDFTKLAMIAPYIAKLTEDGQIELLHSALHLSVKALENNLKESKGLVASDNCLHKETEIWRRCISCNKFIKET